MERTFAYRIPRRTLYWSLLYLTVCGALVAALVLLSKGGFLSAWFVSMIVALIALMALSIPRRIVVRPATVEILCLLDMTELPRPEIASVRRVGNRRMRWMFPLFGACGFFGFYGHFLDLRRFDRVRIYASEWRDFVEITDIYEQRWYVSCDRADELVALLREGLAPHPEIEAELREEDEEELADA